MLNLTASILCNVARDNLDEEVELIHHKFDQLCVAYRAAYKEKVQS